MFTHCQCYAVSKQETCEKPNFVDWAVWEHGCVHERNVCLDQVRVLPDFLCWPRTIYASIFLRGVVFWSWHAAEPHRDLEPCHVLCITSKLVCYACFFLDCLCLQGTFVVFQDKVKPGKSFTGSQLFDTGGAFFNMPGYLDNLKVGCVV